ncbi:MAG: hypothetical protein IJI54_04925 [Kiritimatiellae bacterium]|nr:hypothetical protein [Kiritimatiellia bacterium]MBQ6140612.1 hypothetical protein [Kiritimatiellia bacterium]
MTTRFSLQSLAQRMMAYLESLLCKKVKIFDLFGIEFFLNSSVVAIPIFLTFTGNLSWGVCVYVLAIAASILLHELGHALGGYVVGNPAKEICLIACGGYTIFSRNPGVSAKDAFMSLTGPLTNGLVCGLLIWIGINRWGGSFWEWAHLLFSQLLGEDISMDELPYSFVLLNYVALVNACMLVFNMLPAFPLDGGRIFRWLVGCFLPSQKAAFVTMLVARMLACMIVGRSIITDLMTDFNPLNLGIMILIGLWIWSGSKTELWRTKLYCAAEAGSREAMAEIRNLFNEEVWPNRRR